MSKELMLYKALIMIMKIPILISVLLVASITNADLNLELPNLNLPDLGGNAGMVSTSFSEREVGIKILRKLRSSGNLIEDPELNIWIRSIGNRLTSNAPRSSTPYYFVISRDQSVNAFATLGGVVVINSGLILRTKSESELAAVLAHETAHITQRHIPRMIKKAEGNKLASGAAILAGILASTKDPEAGQVIINLSLATMAHKQLAFSREAEAEADRVGLRILARAGFNPKAMSSFLAKLEQYSSGQDMEVREYLQNHPLTLKRVSDTRSRSDRIKGYKVKRGKSFLYMREKIRIISKSNTPIPNQLPVNIRKYSNALRITQKNAYGPALKMINSKSLPSTILRGKLLNNLLRYKESKALLEPLIKVYLGNEALSLLLSRAYVSTGQLDKAWAIVNDVTISEQTSLEFLEEKQYVARVTRRNSVAYRVSAEQNIRRGNYSAAETLLRQALKLPSASTNELLLIQKRLAQIKGVKN